MEQMYQEVILDHYKHPHHRGLREPFGAEVHHVNPTCGDEVTLRVALSDDGESVADISYDGQGCSISQAATSVLTDQVIGQSVGAALTTVAAFTEMISSRGNVEGDEDVIGDGIAFAGVAKYPARVKCALLGWMAFKDALAQASAQSDSQEEEHERSERSERSERNGNGNRQRGIDSGGHERSERGIDSGGHERSERGIDSATG